MREFLQPPPADGTPTSARTAAKQIDRDAQMPYDIAKNDEGPLKRTVGSKDVVVNAEERPRKRVKRMEDGETADSHPGFDERLRNIETHLAVKYGGLQSVYIGT